MHTDKGNKGAVTSDGRAKRFRRNREAEGLIQVSAWIPAAAAPDFYIIAESLRRDRELGFGPVRHIPTGRLRRAR